MNRNILNLRHLTVLLMLCTAFLGGTIPAFAQQAGKKITGQVIDENKEPMIGVSILIVGTSTGTVTDFDGNYTLNVPQGNKELQFSYVGYETKIVPLPASGSVLNVQMKSDSQVLSDVVVIGYGTQRKSDLTGSVTNVSSKDFNMGLVSSPEQLINGKISGVQIMSNSGSPTAGSTIRVRGGASLNASNDPLIVLDGVPLEQGGISGNDGNFLSLINPNDIESMTILKDASSTAIYGSRASNGVILITTKKGTSDKLQITFSTTNSIQTRTKLADMLSYNQFVNTIQSQGSAAQQALLGNVRTDWNDEIYQNAFGTDNNLSVSGKIAKNWPFRVSVGYYNQSGLSNRQCGALYGKHHADPFFLQRPPEVEHQCQRFYQQQYIRQYRRYLGCGYHESDHSRLFRTGYLRRIYGSDGQHGHSCQRSRDEPRRTYQDE